MARRCKKSAGEEVAVNFIILILLLPVIGAFMLGSDDPNKKTFGGVLLVIGLIIWIAMGA